MKCLSVIAFALTLTLPATAQLMGAINSDAPTVTSGIEFKDGGKVSIRYTAIHFGEGAWLKQKDDANARERLNQLAPQRPLGKVDVSMDVVVAGKTVPAGSYAMFFTIHESGTWVLNLRPEGEDDAELIRWGLRLKESEHKYSRLTVAIAAGDAADSASVMVAFGNERVVVPVTQTGEAGATSRKSQDGN